MKSQIDALPKDAVITIDSEPFSNAADIAGRYAGGGFDDIVVVAPLSVISKLIEIGIKPLWAEMELVDKAHSEVEAVGRYYRFVQFKRVARIAMEFEDAFVTNGKM